MKTDTDIPTAVFVIVCMTVAGVFGYFTGMHRVEVKRMVMKPTTNEVQWSQRSSPETVLPSPPHPQWVMLQYRTNMITGAITARIIAHGSPRGMFEPETAIVTTNEPPYLFDTHIDHTAPRVR